jgi:hypothetical protein
MSIRSLAQFAIACALAGGLQACGTGNAQEAVAVRVGDRSIASATVAHWMTVMAPQHIVPDSPHFAACFARRRSLDPRAGTSELTDQCRQQYEALTQRVLGFLISSRWRIDESAEEGMPVSREEVRRRIDEKERSFPRGKDEFEESLKAIAHTREDVELETESEIATEKIRGKLVSTEPAVTEADIEAHYRASIDRYHIPEQRHFYIAENFPSAAAARKVMAEIRAGRSLRSTSLSESLPRKPYTDYNGEKRTIYEAIFKARPRVLTGPIRLNNLYFLIEVRDIVPARVQSFAEVRDKIAERVKVKLQRRTLAAFVAAWRAKWVARTDCGVGYVVPKCRQYHGPRPSEDPVELN